MIEQKELLNIDYGPVFEKAVFEYSKNYLRNSKITIDEIVRDGHKEIYYFENGIGSVIVNNRLRTVSFRLVDKSTLSELSFELLDAVTIVLKSQKARVAHG